MKKSMGFARAAIIAAAMAVTAVLPASAAATDDSWQVSKASGEIWLVDPEGGGAAAPVEHALGNSKSIAPGQSIRTGKDGRILLVWGENSMFVQPSSLVTAPAITPDGKTNMIQRAGEVIFKVERKQTPHFEVQTPYLVALVKGTVFRVSLEKETASVGVKEGRVKVSDPKTGQSVLVLPQQQASVSTDGISGLSVVGDGEIGPIEEGAPFAAVAPLKVAARSGADAQLGSGDVDGASATRGLMVGIAIGVFGALAFAVIRTRFA